MLTSLVESDNYYSFSSLFRILILSFPPESFLLPVIQIAILSSVWSTLFPALSDAFFISFTKFFSSRIFPWFFNLNLFGNYLFCSLFLFQSSLNCLSEFSFSLLNFFITAILNSSSDFSIPCLWVWLLENCHFLSVLLCSFSVPEMCLCRHIWRSKSLSYLGKTWFSLVLAVQ